MQVDTSGTTQITNPKQYYHCKQNTPTAKPKAILGSFAKYSRGPYLHLVIRNHTICFLQPKPLLSRIRRLGHQNEGFHAFCNRSHPYRGFVGWVAKAKDSMFSEPKPPLLRIRRLVRQSEDSMLSAAEGTPIEDSSAGSPKRRIL
jgi:hypothetical protein